MSVDLLRPAHSWATGDAPFLPTEGWLDSQPPLDLSPGRHRLTQIKPKVWVVSGAGWGVHVCGR